MMRMCSLAFIAFFFIFPAETPAPGFPTRLVNAASQAESQERELKTLIERLASDDIAERERALSALKATPLERLSVLEAKLDSNDEEFRLRLRGAISGTSFQPGPRRQSDM